MTRYLLMMAMVILTPPKGSGGMPLAPKPAVIEARVWDKLAAALSFVESRNDDRAYNASSGALGRWQMKRVYVDEVNRILRLKRQKKRYRYDDRTNPVKAREMFEIYQSHHNPKKDIDRAIRLHRGLHSPMYVKEVKRKLRNNMNREVLINIINRGRIRFIPVRRCFLCNEYVGYKFVRMCDGSMIPVFSSGCRCCGINNGTLSERTWDEVLDLVKTVQNKPMNERTEEDEFILNSLI